MVFTHIAIIYNKMTVHIFLRDLEGAVKDQDDFSDGRIPRSAAWEMDKTQKTFAEQFYLEEAGFFRRLGRDIRLLVYLVMTIIMWVKAGKFRSEFRRCRAAGEPYYVDRFSSPETEK